MTDFIDGRSVCIGCGLGYDPKDKPEECRCGCSRFRWLSFEEVAVERGKARERTQIRDRAASMGLRFETANPATEEWEAFRS